MTASVIARRRSLFLRVHFWSALIASPFAVLAALTGLLYVFTPQVEAMLYGHLDRVAPAGVARPLDDIVRAAQAAAPVGRKLKSVMVPGRADTSVQVVFNPAPAPGGEHAGHAGHAGHGGPASAAAPSDRLPRGLVVYVDPYTARVLGSHAEMERFGTWSKRLHSSLLQGDGWRWMIELAASWLMVMLLTGIWLWWPRGAASGLPQAGARGRTAWKQWHAFVGVTLCVMSLAILSTGLTWSRHAGEQIRSFRDAIGQAPPSAPKGVQSMADEGKDPLAWQDILQIARRSAPDVALVMTPPRSAEGVWRIQTPDQAEPTKKVSLVLDAYSGRPLFETGWAQQTAFGKATAIGIPFHRGEFGVWNQVLLFLFGAGVLFSLVSGWVMFVLRRRQGGTLLPRLLPGAVTAMPVGGWVAAAVLLLAMPLFAFSGAMVVVAEIALAWRGRMRMLLAQGESP